jgi:hypothetical protein
MSNRPRRGARILDSSQNNRLGLFSCPSRRSFCKDIEPMTV